VSEPERFGWSETPEAIADCLREWAGPSPLADEGARRFVVEEQGRRLEIRIPLVLARARPGQLLESWLADAHEPPGRQLLVLMQAGACALGLFEAGELIEHLTLKRYVVRGSGRAQPAYLKTKGKSRYGSRLRLRNAQRLLEDAAATMRDWHEVHGPFDRVFHSCPLRTWAELLREDLPFDGEGPLVKVPLDLNRPTFAEMQRAWRALSHGSWLISS